MALQIDRSAGRRGRAGVYTAVVAGKKLAVRAFGEPGSLVLAAGRRFAFERLDFSPAGVPAAGPSGDVDILGWPLLEVVRLTDRAGGWFWNDEPRSLAQWLAALFSSRTQYSSSSRELTFGTVVRYRPKNSKKKKTPWQYAVCLVPACDSLRLKIEQPSHFPFWRIESEVYKSNSRRKGMVLIAADGQEISLSAGGNAGEKLWTDSFTVDKKSKTVVALRVKGTFKYGGTKRTIEWLGQLKPLHAHRIAHEITDGLSRVGVTEAEWLRLLCERGH